MSSISCTEFSRLVEQCVESREPVDVAVLREHAMECAECRPAWLDALLLDQAVARWKFALPDVELTESVLSRRAFSAAGRVESSSKSSSDAVKPVEREAAPRPTVAPSRTSRARWASLIAAFAVAAAALAAVIAVRVNRDDASPPITDRSESGIRTGSGIASANQPVPFDPTDGKGRIDLATDAQVQLLVRETGSAYWDLASEAADAVTAAAVLLPPADRPSAARAGTTKDDLRWVDQVTRELEPVTRHLSQAFEFLFEAVPAGNASAT